MRPAGRAWPGRLWLVRAGAGSGIQVGIPPGGL